MSQRPPRTAEGPAAAQYFFDRRKQTASVIVATDDGPDPVNLTKDEALAALSDAPAFLAGLAELHAAALVKRNYE